MAAKRTRAQTDEKPLAQEAESLSALCRKAERGDRAALTLAKAKFDEVPTLWRIYDLGGAAERILTKEAAGENEMLREGIRRRMDELRAELAGPSPSRLERLLVERIALCWLQVTYAEAREAQNLGRSMSLAQSEHAQKSTDRAHKRLHAAVKSLALVRRLALPAVQVNIAAEGGKQVNIAQAAVDAAGAEVGS